MVAKYKNIKVVIGANYGDEGKGRVVDYFANKSKDKKYNTIVVCTNGGAQRGHTVINDEGFQHIFHHFGSGTLAGADTYLPEYFIVNPMIFMKEYEHLDFCAPQVFIHPDCLVSTPFDMMNNQIIEEHREFTTGNKHGSCGVGIWETILRDGIRYKEMIQMTDEDLFIYLKQVRDRYSANRLYKKGVSMPEGWAKIYFNDEMIHHYIRDFRAMSDPKIGIAKLAKYDILKHYDTIIFENGQGMLLDEEYSPKIYSTPSKTTLDLPMKIINLVFPTDPYKLEVCYVTRSYLTRHCLGEFREEIPNQEVNFVSPNFETNTHNIHQGNFRYGLISDTTLFQMYTRIYHDFKTNTENLTSDPRLVYHSVAMTHLDEKYFDVQKLIDLKFFNAKTIYSFYGRKSSDKVTIKYIGKDSNSDSITHTLPNGITFDLSYSEDGEIVIDYSK